MGAPFRHLPSLAALRVFESAGRHLSFTNAAAELCVTTSAVSRQIRALEEEIGRSLFDTPAPRARAHQGGGRVSHPRRRRAPAPRRRQCRTARDRRRRQLRLSVLASFAGNWLVPRLPAFERAYPDIDVAMEATTRYADFARDPSTSRSVSAPDRGRVSSRSRSSRSSSIPCAAPAAARRRAAVEKAR